MSDATVPDRRTTYSPDFFGDGLAAGLGADDELDAETVLPVFALAIRLQR